VRKRQWKTYHSSTDDNSEQHLNQVANPDSKSTTPEIPSPMIQYDGITIWDISNTSAHSDVAQFAALPSVDVSVDIVTENKFTKKHQNTTSQCSYRLQLLYKSDCEQLSCRL
jgi:hypothetical protein